MRATLKDLGAEYKDGSAHSLEVVARAEADGYSDADARREGWDDLFAYAAWTAGFVRSPRGPHTDGAFPESQSDSRPEPSAGAVEASAPDVKRGSLVWVAILRGLLFALPGLSLSTLLPTNTSTAVTAVLLVGLVVPWGVGQGLAYFAYTLQAQRLGSEKRPLLVILLATAGVCALLDFALIAVTGNGLLAALVAVQTLYLVSATIALVRGAGVYLLAALVPSAFSGLMRLSGGLENGPSTWQLVTVAISFAACWAIAVASCVPLQSRSVETQSVRFRSVMTFTCYGWLVALTVVWLPMSFVGVSTFVALLALTLSMGAAEAAMIVYRKRGRRWLEQASTTFEFEGLARRGLVRLMAVYGGVLAVLLLVASAIELAALGGPVSEVLLISFDALALGLSLLLAGLLVAFRAIGSVVMQWVGAVSLLALSLVLVPDVSPLLTGSVVYAVLLASLIVAAFAEVSRPNLHL